MASKRSSNHALDGEDEMPSLTTSDTSRGGFSDGASRHSSASDASRRLSDASRDSSQARLREESSTQSDGSTARRRRKAEKASTSSSRARAGSRARSKSRSRARSRSRPRSRSAARRRPENHEKHEKPERLPAVTKPAPPPPSAPKPNSRRRRRPNQSYSRCASSGGTTLYRTPHMATLDSYLRTTSGLRLQMDGTCNFVFEYQRFSIEASDDDTGDFLFYASFGALGELQRRTRPRNLLRLLAAWNEELKRRHGGGGGEDEEGENTGLLRIDSSKADGPHVAFIYYGHVGEIRDAASFQETMDDFVDDALEFSEKLRGGAEEDDRREHMDPEEYEERTKNTAEKNRTASPPSYDSKSLPGRNRSFYDSDDDSAKDANSWGSDREEPLAAPAVTASDVYHAYATSKKNVFSKMISGLRSKSNDKSVEKNAFVDPSNPACAFVVDKSAAEEGNIKPTIVLSRKGGEKGSSFHDGSAPTRARGSSFHDSGSITRGKGASFHDAGPPVTRAKGASFHDSGPPVTRAKGASFHSRAYPPPPTKAKSKSFHDHHRKRSSLTESELEYERSSQSCGAHARSNPASQFTRSEPVGVMRSHRAEEDGYPEPPPTSRRHSAALSEVSERTERSKQSQRSSRRSKPSKRHSDVNEERRSRGKSKGRDRGSRMNRSEPAMPTGHRRSPPPALFM